MNLGKSKVIRYSRYVYVGRLDMRLNGEQLEEVDCFVYLGSQVAVNRGCEMDVRQSMNNGV